MLKEIKLIAKVCENPMINGKMKRKKGEEGYEKIL